MRIDVTMMPKSHEGLLFSYFSTAANPKLNK